MTFKTDFWSALPQQGQQQQLPEGAISAQQVLHNLMLDAAVNGGLSPWVVSPAAGVQRILLERDGGEVTTRATSSVAYSPASRFAAHSHPRGEEIFVLTGIFSNQTGHYPVGSYLRNAPFSSDGCLIFVKLQQVALPAHALEEPGSPQTLQRRVLFTRASEHVELIRFNEDAHLPADLARASAEGRRPHQLQH